MSETVRYYNLSELTARELLELRAAVEAEIQRRRDSNPENFKNKRLNGRRKELEQTLALCDQAFDVARAEMERLNEQADLIAMQRDALATDLARVRAALLALQVYPSRNCWGRYGCDGSGTTHDDLCEQARAVLEGGG